MNNNEEVIFDSILSGIRAKELDKGRQAPEPKLTEDEKDLVRKCESMFEFSRRHKQVFMERMRKNYQLYMGKQWDMRQPSFKTIPVTNIIWGIVEYEVPLMTENKPILKAEPRGVDDIAFSDGATKALEYVWDDNDLTDKLPYIMRNVLVFGDHFIKVYWDYNNKRIVVDDVEPDHFYPQPFVSDIKNMDWCIHAEPRALYEIAGLYPNGKYVRQESYVSPLEEVIEEDTKNLSVNEPFEALMAEGKATGATGQNLTMDRAIVKEMWINDRTLVRKYKVVHDEETGEPMFELNEDSTDYKYDDEGNPIPKKVAYYERKYPYGRIIVWANNVLLMDAPSPFRHGRAPYVHFNNSRLGRSFWSIGDPYQLTSIQTQLNKRKAQIDFIADLMGNPIWVCDVGSGVKRNQLTNQPGLIVWKRDGSDVRRENPPPIPEYMFRTIYDLKDEADFVSGMQDVVRGDKPGSVTAATAINELVERALTRIKEKVKYMESSLVEAGSLIMSLVRQYWDEPKQFTIMGEHQQMKSIQFSGSMLNEDPDIKIVAGSTMPVSKQSKFDQAVIMFNLGIIDIETFLRYVEFPNADSVIAKMEQKQQEAMQMQQQQMQMQQQQRQAELAVKLQQSQLQANSKLGQAEIQANSKLTEQQMRDTAQMNRDAMQMEQQERMRQMQEMFGMQQQLFGPTQAGSPQDQSSEGV